MQMTRCFNIHTPEIHSFAQGQARPIELGRVLQSILFIRIPIVELIQECFKMNR